MKEAFNEVNEFFEKNAWMNEIYQFCKAWGGHSLQEWEGAQAFTIEVSYFLWVIRYVLVLQGSG